MKQYLVTVLTVLMAIAANLNAQDKPLSINHGPYIQNVSGSGVTIVFSTDGYVLPGVLLSESNKEPRLIRNSHDGLVNVGNGVHKVRIDDLKEGQQYSYQVMAVEIKDHQAYSVTYGDTLYSGKHSFSTFSADKELVKFTMFNDVHDNSAKIGSYLEQTKINEQDFFLLNGDIIGHVDDEHQIYHNFIDTCANRFASRIPMMYVRGNHETRGCYARRLKNYFDFENDKYYYAFTQGNTRFIVLDTGEDKPDNHGEYFGLVDFDAYRAEQLAWLEQEVASSEFQNAEVKIVFAHMPVLKLKKSWHGMAQLAKHYGPVLNKANIDLMLCGHTHQNAWMDAKKVGFGYPMMICSNEDFLEAIVEKGQIKIWIKNQKGEEVDYKEVKLK